jgi:hypothetical protein
MWFTQRKRNEEGNKERKQRAIKNQGNMQNRKK